MPAYRYVGLYDRVYPEIRNHEGSLRVSPGDVLDLPSPPDDGSWVRASAAELPKARAATEKGD
jgi:hypothetical protein